MGCRAVGLDELRRVEVDSKTRSPGKETAQKRLHSGTGQVGRRTPTALPALAAAGPGAAAAAPETGGLAALAAALVSGWWGGPGSGVAQGPGALAALRSVDLSENHLAGGGLAVVAAGLAGLPALAELLLRRCDLADDGAAALAAALRAGVGGKSLSRLDLRDNCLGVGGLVTMSGLAGSLPKLAKLDLRGQRGAEPAELLAGGAAVGKAADALARGLNGERRHLARSAVVSGVPVGGCSDGASVALRHCQHPFISAFIQRALSVEIRTHSIVPELHACSVGTD